VPADVDDELYTFSRDVLIDWLRERDEGESACLVIGHNPALTELVNWLDPPARLENLPTAAYAGLELDIDRWSDLACGCGRLVTLIRPRDL
jgi:phosphohistidine phosphatase